MATISTLQLDTKKFLYVQLTNDLRVVVIVNQGDFFLFLNK